MTQGIETHKAISRSVLFRESKLIGLVSMGHFFSHFFLLVLPPLFPLLKVEFGVSYTSLGGIIAVYAVCSALSQYPIGYLSDKFGAPKFLIIGLGIISTTFVAMSFATSLAPIYALAVLAGLADGVFHPCDYAILSSSIPQKRSGRAYAIHAFGGFAGFAVAPMVVVPLTAWFSWQAAVMAAGCAGLLVTLLLLVNYRTLSTQTAEHTAAITSKTTSGNKGVLLSLPLVMMFGFYAVSSTANIGITTHLAAIIIALTDKPFEAVTIALPVYLWGIAIGILAGGVAADIIKRLDLTATLGILGAGLFLLVVALFKLPFTLIVAALFCGGFCYGSSLASRDVVVRAVAPADALGRAFGFVNTGYGIGSAVGPIMIGWILDHASPSTALLVPSVFLMAAMLFTLSALKLPGSKHKNQN